MSAYIKTSFTQSLLSHAVIGKDKIEVTEEDLKKLSFIKWCTLEAIQLRSPGAITKKVVNPIKIQVSFVELWFSPTGCYMICLESSLPITLDKIK